MIEWDKKGWQVHLGTLSSVMFATTHHDLLPSKDKRQPPSDIYYLKWLPSGDEFKFTTLEAAKAKAEELLTEWLTTAIKDLPEDKLAELGVVRIPEFSGAFKDSIADIKKALDDDKNRQHNTPPPQQTCCSICQTVHYVDRGCPKCAPIQ